LNTNIKELMRGAKKLDNINVNNEVHLAGQIYSKLTPSHEVYGERFLLFV